AMAATAAESIGAVKVVHALSLEGTFAQAFTKQSRKNLATGAAATRLEAALERTVDLLIAVATALVLWSGAHFVLRGAMTLGDLVVIAPRSTKCAPLRSEEHTSELQSRVDLVCRLLLEKKKYHTQTAEDRNKRAMRTAST